MLFLQQLIFRKVADVKREQELAERRKNEPQQQDLAQDHLVRKIFSKFRKPSDAGAAFSSRPTSSGASTQKVTPLKATATVVDAEAGVKPPSLADAFSKLKAPPEGESAPESRASTGKSGPKLSRWAALTGGKQQPEETSPTTTDRVLTGKTVKEEDDKDDKETALGRRTELVCRKSEHIHVVKDIRPATQGNKWPKVAPSVKPDTIDESGEGDTSVSGGLILGDSAGGLAARQRASVTSLVPLKGSVNAADLQQLVSTLLDIKVDIKTEIAKINSRINKIDQHVEDVTTKMMTAQQQFYADLKERQTLEAAEESKVKKRSQDKSPRGRPTSKTKIRTTPASSRVSSSLPTTSGTPEVSSEVTQQQDPQIEQQREIAEQEAEESPAGGGGATDEDQDLTSKL